MEKVVTNVVIHTELRFLTWIFQASSADRTAKWQSGRSRQHGHVDCASGGPASPIARLLQKVQVTPGITDKPRHTQGCPATTMPCREGVEKFHHSSSSVLFSTGYHFPVQRGDTDSAGSQCPSNSCACSTERKKQQADGLLQLFPNSLAGLLLEHQTSLLALPLLLWPHGCRTVRSAARVPSSLSQRAHPPTTGIPAVLAHKSHNGRRRPIFLT